jgi:hypothetical protein
MIQIYWNEKTGAILVPYSVKTEDGFWLSVEPVETAHVNDEFSVCNAVRKITGLGVRVVPTPARAAFPKPIILKYAGSKTWSAFQRTHELVALEEDANGQWRIEPWQRVNDRSYAPNLALLKVLPERATLDDAVSEVIQHIKTMRNSTDPA